MLVIITIILALFFNFLNGANDRANALATTTATGALPPIAALLLTSVFNVLGAFASTRVAETIGKGIVPSAQVTLPLLLTGVLGSIIWVFICTSFGIPISVSHALVGGILGAGLMSGGKGIIDWHIFNNKVLLAIVLGPGAGFLAGAFVLSVISWTVHLFFKKLSTHKVNKFFLVGQIFTTPFMSFTHGMNDTQNAMGIIAAALLAGGITESFVVPWWVKITCGVVMGVGTFLMGWRVVRTLGWELTKVEPQHGFSAEFASGAVIGLHSLAGMPISTTHVVGSTLLGGTALQNWRRIKQTIAWKMIIAWVITIPCAGAFAGLAHLIFNYLV